MNSCKKLFPIILLSTIVLFLSSCQQEIFVAHYGQNAGEFVASIDKVSQNHFYVTGKIQGTSKLFVMRNSNNGNITWTRSYGLGPNAYPSDIASTLNGGCVVVGHGFLQISNSFIVRLNASGQEDWKREFTPFGPSNIMVKNAIEMNNGHIAIVGTLAVSSGITAPVIIKLDANGNNPSYWRYNADDFYGTEIKQHPTTSELILLAENHPGSNSLLMSIDPNTGTPSWSTYLNSVRGLGLEVDNNEIYISGHIGPSSNSDPFLLQTNLNGNVQWAHRYTIPGNQDECNLSRGAKGEFAISGLTNNGLFLLTTNQVGQTKWYREYLGNYNLIPSNYVTGHGSHTAIHFNNGGYGLAAHDISTSNPAGFATVIRTNDNGNAPCNQISGIPIPNSFTVTQTSGGLNLETINMGMNPATNPIVTENFARDDECRQGNCTPPPKSLIAWFPLGTNGNDYDLINGNQASLGGGSIPLTPGKVGIAYNFNGTNNYLIAPNDPTYDFGTGDFSIDFWVNLGNSASGQQVVVSKIDGRGYGVSFNNNLIELTLNDGTSSNTFTSAQGVPTDNQWHFVAITVDRSSTSGIKYYMDGIQQPITRNPTSVNNSLSNNGNLFIGKHPTLGQFFGGELDEIELFNEALSSLTIERIYAAGSAGKCKNVAYAPEVVGYCTSQTVVTVGITLCNYGNNQRTYTLQNLAGLPTGANGGSCDVNGPTSYTDLTGSLTLNSGNCGVYLINITKPVGLTTPFDRACYQVTFEDDTDNTFWAEGSVVDLSAICLVVQSNGSPLEAIILSPGQKKKLRMVLQNKNEYDIRGRIGLSDPKRENLTLNSLNKKVRLDNFIIPAGKTLEIPLTINLFLNQPFRAQSLIVEVKKQNSQRFERIREIPINGQRK